MASVIQLTVLSGLLMASPACVHEEKLIEQNRAISAEIDKVAEKIDVYAANDRLSDEPNDSKLIVFNNFKFAEGGVREYKPHLGIHLHLPNVQQKVQLRFTSYNEDDAERGINAHRYQSDQGDEVYGGSLAFFQDLGNVKTEFRPRVEYIDDKFQTSYLFKFWSNAERGSFFMEPEAQLFARSDSGTGQFVGLNCGFRQTKQDDLLLVNEEQYTDGDNTMTTNHGFQWDHRYSKIYEHRHTLIFEANNRETFHHERFVLSSRFLHRWYNEILHYGVTPYVVFEKARKYRGSTGIDLRVEVIF